MEQHDTQKVRILFVTWGGLTFTNLVYGMLAYIISRQRASAPATAPLTDRLVGPLSILPYVLPLFLGAAGVALFHVLLRTISGNQTDYIGKVRVATVGMMVIFEANVIIGLLFFFLGTPLEKFMLFGIGTIILDLIGLHRLITALSR